jgi:murein DD-endopeptidase MepM/ murein hydrolase activator NlpD
MQLVVRATVAGLIAAAAVSAATAGGPAGVVPSSASPAVVVPGKTAPTDPPAAAIPSSTLGVWSRGGLAFTWPLSPRPVVRRRFEQPRDQWAPGHRGVDLLAVVGQPVVSAGEGAVAFSGVVAGRGVITIRHAGGLRTSYEPVDQRLTSGTLVHRGTRIGLVSSDAGHCAPLTCLHWGAISGQTYRDPLSLLGSVRPTLLPLD